MTRTAAFAAVAVVLILLGGTYWWTAMRTSDAAFAECRGSQVAGGAATIGGPFELVNGAGETVTDADVLTKPSLIYFGYTFCPDVCPFDVSRNASAVDLLQDRGLDVQPVFISIDPERDTPEVVGEFAGYMHEDMIGLTGSPAQVKAASQAYKTYYARQDSDDEFYLVDHSTFTYLVLPKHGFVDFFRREATPESMAERTACYVEAAAVTN